MMLRTVDAKTMPPANWALIPYRSGSMTEKTAEGKEDATMTTVPVTPLIPKIWTAASPAINPQPTRKIIPAAK